MLSQITDVPDFQSPPIDRRGLGEVDVTPPARVSVCLLAATYLGSSNRDEGPAVEARLAKVPIERFVVAVLPRALGLDEVRVGGAFR